MPYYVRRFSPRGNRRPPYTGRGLIGDEWEYPLPIRWYHPVGDPNDINVGFTYSGIWSNPGEEVPLAWMWWQHLEVTTNFENPSFLQLPIIFPPSPIATDTLLFIMEPTILSTSGEPGYRAQAEIISPITPSGPSDNWIEYAFPPTGPYRWFRLVPTLFPEPGWVWRDGAFIAHQIRAGQLFACNVCRERSGPGLPGDPPLPGPDSPAPIFP